MQLEFDLAYYKDAVQHFNHYTTRTPPPLQVRKKVIIDLVWFGGISTIVDYLMTNPFLYIKQFYFKQFRLT